MSTICLCMIAGNEHRVIERSLASTRPYITTYRIHCNGSDQTARLARDFLAGLDGQVIENAWVNQEHNRNLALRDALASGADYVLCIDADEVLDAPDGFVLPALAADAYNLPVVWDPEGLNEYETMRPMLLRAAIPWTWIGKRHPQLAGPGASAPATLEGGLRCLPRPDGASWSEPGKYHRHVDEMLGQVAADPKNPRLNYYLAQSLRDAGMYEEAAAQFLTRGALVGFVEETWSAHYQRARMLEQIGASTTEVVSAYLKAYRYRPSRAEAPYRLARYLRGRGEPALALAFARIAAELGKPPDRSFIETAVYKWAALEELALCQWHAGERRAALRTCNQVLALAPQSERQRIEDTQRTISGTSNEGPHAAQSA